MENKDSQEAMEKICCKMCEHLDVPVPYFVAHLMVEMGDDCIVELVVFKSSMKIEGVDNINPFTNDGLDELLTDKLFNKKIVFDGDKKEEGDDVIQYQAIICKLSDEPDDVQA